MGLVIPMYYHPLLATTSGTELNAWNIRQSIKKEGMLENDVKINILIENQEINSIITNIDKSILLKRAVDLKYCKESFTQFNSILTKIFRSNAPNLSRLEQAINYC